MKGIKFRLIRDSSTEDCCYGQCLSNLKNGISNEWRFFKSVKFAANGYHNLVLKTNLYFYTSN